MSYPGKYSAKVLEDSDDPREVALRTAELDLKTNALVQIGAIAGRAAASGQQARPTRQELDALDGLYATVTGVPGESEKKPRTLLI
jgi:hypothetical protein